MENSIRVGIILCLTIVLAFSLSLVFAGNEKVNATKSVNATNVTKNMTNATKNMTNATNPFSHVKGMSYLNNTSLQPNEVQLTTNLPKKPPPLGGGGSKTGGLG